MEHRDIRRTGRQALRERFQYWSMRGGSRKLRLFGLVGAGVLCLEYFFLFPLLGMPLTKIIGSLTVLALLLCPLCYLNYGYGHLKQ